MINEQWKKPSYSQGGSNCVECRGGLGWVDMRDTQNRSHGHLAFAPSAWAAFLADVKGDEL